MAGDRDNAISHVDDLVTLLYLNSICCVVQARGQRATPQRISLCTDNIRVCTSPTVALHKSSTLDGLTGKLLTDILQRIENQLPSLTDIWMEIR
jgi:hypothetical protein